MGFISKLFGKERHGRHAIGDAETEKPKHFTRADIPTLSQGGSSETSSVDSKTVSGDIEYQVYVYDGSPLRGLRSGQIFAAQIDHGHVRLKSRLTDGVWDSRKDDGFALSYRGMPFGVSFNNELRDYLIHVNAQAVTVRHDGWYDRSAGIPELKILAPSTRHSPTEDAVARLAGVSRFDVATNVESIAVNVSRHSDAIERTLGRRSQSDITVELELIPTPENSSAKPHIGINSSGDGVRLAEITARQPVYRQLLAKVGSTAKASVEKRESFIEDDDDGFYYRFILVFG